MYFVSLMERIELTCLLSINSLKAFYFYYLDKLSLGDEGTAGLISLLNARLRYPGYLGIPLFSIMCFSSSFD